MLFSRQSIGMEIFNGGLKMAVATGKAADPKLLSCTTLPLPADVLHVSFKQVNILNPARFVAAVRDTYLKQLVKGNRISLSLPDNAGRVMLVDLETRFKNREEGADIIRWSLKKNFPIDMDQVHLDYQILREAETGEVTTFVSLISKEIVNQYEDLLQEAGLEPNLIEFATFSLYRLFSKRLQMADNAAFISFFGGIISITLFREGILDFYRSKEIGTDQTELERMFREIDRSLLLYKQKHPTNTFSEVFSAAEPGTAGGLHQVVREATGQEPVELVVADFVGRSSAGNCDAKTLQLLAPALGAAMRNL